MRVENERGEFFLIETEVHMEVRHGDVPLSRFHTLDRATVGVLTAEPDLQAFNLAEAAFLDTETTGLAGGAGTAAFLIGLGFVDGERFRVRQYFMRDYHEEAALLHALAEDLGRFRHLVTFNGKMFDVPLLDARYRLNRARFPLAEVAALRPAAPRAAPLEGAARVRAGYSRSRWSCWGSTAWATCPGEQIPQIYFDFVRRRDARALARVFEHNRQDIVSLAALAVLACQWVEEGRAEDPRDVYSLARVLERARLYERSDAEYRRTLALDPGPPSRGGPDAPGRAGQAHRRSRHRGRALGGGGGVGGAARPAGACGPPRAPKPGAPGCPRRRGSRDALALAGPPDDPRSRRQRGGFLHPASAAAEAGPSYVSSIFRNSISSWMITGLVNTAIPDFSGFGMRGEFV